MNPETEIVIIGAAIIDILAYPVHEQVFETGSYPAEDIRMSVGADALNEATILARMGKRVKLMTVIGKDSAGEFIREHCRKEGILISDSCLHPELTTGINVVLVKGDGSRSFLTNSNGTLRKLTLLDVSMPFPSEAKILCFASIFVFPEIKGPQLAAIFAQAKSQDMTVCADMTRRKHQETTSDLKEALPYVDYLFPNDEEALLLTGKDTVEAAAEELHQAGVSHVIIKCGKRGCYLRSDQTQEWMEAVKDVACIDTTGAGDSFAAGFLSKLAEGKDWKECARYANVCGARSVQHIGATEWSKT